MRIKSLKLAWSSGQPKNNDRLGAWVFAFLGFESKQLAQRREPCQPGDTRHFEQRAARKVLRSAAGAGSRIERFHNFKIEFGRHGVPASAGEVTYFRELRLRSRSLHFRVLCRLKPGLHT